MFYPKNYDELNAAVGQSIHVSSRQKAPHRPISQVVILLVFWVVMVCIGCDDTDEKPEKATVSNPRTDTLNVSVTPRLQWNDGGGAESYDIYLGTSEVDVAHAEKNDIFFVGNQSEIQYKPTVKLPHNQGYYWRIDSVNEKGTTKGEVWYFKTFNQSTVDAQNDGVHSIETIVGNGRGPKLSPDGKKMVFARLHGDNPGDGSYEIYIADNDGKNEECISQICPDLSEGVHKGAVTWHPDGQWLLLVVEKDRYYGNDDPDVRKLATGGIGHNTDLWLLAADGSRAWRLTDLPTRMDEADTTLPTGILHPQFSNEGTRILYSFTRRAGTDVFGDWEMRIVDFNPPPFASVDHNATVKYQPGEKKHWYETHGWSADDTKIYFSFSPNPQQDDITTDIGVLDLVSYEYENLTDSWQTENTTWDGLSAWDEHAYLSKDNSILGYISSNGYPIRLNSEAHRKNWRNWLITELWWMDPTGQNQEQISVFNDPTAPEYIGENREAIPTGPSWNPETTAFVCGVGIRNLNPITQKPISWSYEIKVFWLDLDGNGVRDANEE